MSLYQCEVCGCRENTALAAQGFRMLSHCFDWTYAPERKGKLLCSACGPVRYLDGEPTRFGKWHGEFRRMFLPLGQFYTNARGNLARLGDNSEDLAAHEIGPPCEFHDFDADACDRHSGLVPCVPAQGWEPADDTRGKA